MISSHPQSSPSPADPSSAIPRFSFADGRRTNGADSGLPGSYDDTSLVRGVLIDSIRRSGESRATIADRMTYFLGRQVTEAMLNAFTAESRNDRRWPGEFDRAFCAATNDNTLLRCRVERAGLRVIEGAELDLLELGRAFHQRTQADARIAELQRALAGGAR